MRKLDATDIQGFVLRGYNLPRARYCFLHFDGKARPYKLHPNCSTWSKKRNRWCLQIQGE